MLRSILALSALVLPLVHCDCQSYGVDYQNAGSYVIDSTSTANFTIESEFSDCVGEADIVLVGPIDDDSWECSDVATSPDYTVVRSSCPILEDQMYTGLWTVVILDNNGNDSSVAFQRSFNLTLAVPSSNISSSVAPATTLITVTGSTTLSNISTSTSDAGIVASVTQAANAVLALVTSAGTTQVSTSTISAAAVKTADPTAGLDLLAVAASVLGSAL